MALEILYTEWLHPRPRSSPRSVPLSVLDAGCARFAPTGAIWIFDHSRLPADELGEQLKTSFVKTLEAFPHLAGQLKWAPWRRHGLHTERFGRAMVDVGSDHESGVEWTVARLHRRASDVALSAAERSSRNQIWINHDFPQSQLLSSKTPLALANLKTWEGLPAMIVQLTILDDNGFAVAVKLAHPLADATSLMTFMNHWTYNNRAHQSNSVSPPPPPSPVFDPQQIDAQAAGDIDASQPDQELVRKARTLPIHRFDWWATSAEGYPSFLIQTSENSKPEDEQLLAEAMKEHSSVPPWETWNLLSSVTHAIVHFTPAQMEALRAKARQYDPRVSRLDAVLGHVWSVINRARGLDNSDADVFMNVTLGVRTRVDPPLPNEFMGSPLMLAHVAARGKDAASTDTGITGQLASRIRSTIEQFTPQTMAAVLHNAAYELCPQRFWQAFLGRNHVLVTAWLRLGVYDVDFCVDGNKARYAHPVMPPMDGCLQVMDGASGDGGMDVSLYLESGAMGKFLEDEHLQAFV